MWKRQALRAAFLFALTLLLACNPERSGRPPSNDAEVSTHGDVKSEPAIPPEFDYRPQTGHVETRDDSTLIDGTWKVTSRHISGRESGTGREEWRTYLRGRVQSFGLDDDDLTYTLDESSSPKAIDFIVTGRDGKANVAKGIYKLDGDKLTLCVAPRGADRPGDFISTPESQCELEVLQRVDEDAIKLHEIDVRREKEKLAGHWIVEEFSGSSGILSPALPEQFVITDATVSKRCKSNAGDNYTVNYTTHRRPSGAQELIQQALDNDASMQARLLLSGYTFYRFVDDDLELLTQATEPRTMDWTNKTGEYYRLRRIPPAIVEARAAELKRLMGKWTIDSAVEYGEQVRGGVGLFGEKGQQYQFDTDQIYLVSDDAEVLESWWFEIDPTTMPKQIALAFAGRIEGIYELADGGMRLCLSLAKKSSTPVDFESTFDDATVLLELRKVMEND